MSYERPEPCDVGALLPAPVQIVTQLVGRDVSGCLVPLTGTCGAPAIGGEIYGTMAFGISQNGTQIGNHFVAQRYLEDFYHGPTTVTTFDPMDQCVHLLDASTGNIAITIPLISVGSGLIGACKNNHFWYKRVDTNNSNTATLTVNAGNSFEGTPGGSYSFPIRTTAGSSILIYFAQNGDVWILAKN